MSETASPIARWLAASAVYTRPRVIAVLLLGFSSGLPLALTGATLQAWMTDSGVDLTLIGIFALVGLPYSIKFVWAPLVDRVRLPLLARRLGHRRAWLLTTQALLALAVVGLGFTDPASAPWMTAALAVAVAFLSASQDIVIDAFRIESLEVDQQGAGAAVYIGGYRIAMLTSGAGALILAQYFDWQVSYLAMAALVGIGMATVLASAEPEAADRENEENLRRDQVNRVLGRSSAGVLRDAATWLYTAAVAPFLEFLTRPGAIAVLLFVLLYKFGDALAGAMTTPFILTIGFSKLELAEIAKVYGFGATILGVFLGGWAIRAIGIMKSLWVFGILQAVSNLMFAVQAWYGHDPTVLIATVAIENLAGGMGTAAFVAYLSALCNVAYTATQYALLSSFMSVGRTFLSSPSGWLVENLDWAGGWLWMTGSVAPDTVALQVNWIGFFVLTTFAAVPGLIMLAWLMRRGIVPSRQAAATA